ncbi:putative integral membrane protein [Mycobacteroides abscessus subsp. abscessus]|nr:putative integral membrane protein [Mycobacteroides abscessus subsp. abscessus]
MVAYAAARAAGSVPLMPGGLLVVEAFLVPGLVSSGMTLPDAISAMLIYRAVSWVFISAIGWVIFFFLFRDESQIDPDATPAAAKDPDATPGAPPANPPKNSSDPPK